MASSNVLRARQTTATVVSQTPLKETANISSSGRRSLPRSAKIYAELEGYKKQLYLSERFSPSRKENVMTPVTKISHKIAKKLTIRSPENHKEICDSSKSTCRSSAQRHLDLSSKATRKTQMERSFEAMEIEHDENIPPAGDTVGRRISSSKYSVSTIKKDSTQTKNVRSTNSAKAPSCSVSRSNTPKVIRTCNPKDTEILPITVKFRSVFQREDGSFEYRTVGPDSPWGIKRPVAHIVPAIRKSQRLLYRSERDSSADIEECEESSHDILSEDSEECDESVSPSYKSNGRNRIRKAMNSCRSVKKQSINLQKSQVIRKKVEPLESLRLRLHTSEVPDHMPCREEEAEEVKKFILNAISVCGTSSAMYISGVPGTGKTATVMSVVKQLMQDKSCNKFIFVNVNAMEFVEPKRIFVEIYNQITSNSTRISPVVARKKLNAMFEMADRCRPPIVILVDELDQLCTKKQELIYDIFNWTAFEFARVSVMAIANTLDLPERMLSQRVTSRIGSSRICFQPYEFQQIERIIHDRLKGSVDNVDEGAIQFAARKVAAVTGDLRKAMDILRNAIEIAIEQGAKKLLVEHVLKATREASSTLLVQFVEGLSKHGLLLFRSAVSLAEKKEEFSFAELHAQYISFSALIEGIEPLVESMLILLLGQLCATRLLVSSKGNHILRRRIRLGMSYQDAQSAVRIRENVPKA
ncbi:ATPase, AAA family [Dictyocaulus viviparus]|uniref:Origin recognition complex subunit 1 n=1 Tax=Dictyocaulus viviparus TaxID=29172 RepID=A0A0D8XZR9_DICVI|nr:ATPase, AAA family [Dictyocaulus viviparus]